jgi:hypothetical protein
MSNWVSLEQAEFDLQVLEQDPALLQESSFAARAAAIDLIETRILERIEVEQGLGGAAGELGELVRRAYALATRLEEANTHLLQGLEGRIAAGSCRGAALREELVRYAGGASRWDASGRDAVYDYLDLLVAGLLRVGAPPNESGKREPEMVRYQPTPARVILEIIDRARVRPADTFYDLGSGLGQVPILVHLLTGARARGIETEPEYCICARRCAERLNLPMVQFINVDARDADYSEGTVFYLYTPFTGKMLRQVLGMLEAQAGQRPIRLGTYGPCTQEVAHQAWLRCLDRISGDPEFEVALFESS